MISRIERRNDLLLSTQRRYIQAMGGELELVAHFPNRPPVLLDHIAQEPAAKGRAASIKPAGSRGKAIAMMAYQSLVINRSKTNAKLPLMLTAGCDYNSNHASLSFL